MMDGRGSEPASFEAGHPPSLTFTKVISASFNGQEVRPAYWNRLLQVALIEAHAKIGNFEKVRKVAGVNIVDGEKNDEGYQHLPEVGFSVQATDANTAWRAVVDLARDLGCGAEASFFWRNKEGAQHPGKPGIMRLY
jgi:hypothetical protein